MQDPILFLKIPKGKRKNFAETCRQFGNAFSKRFSSPNIDA